MDTSHSYFASKYAEARDKFAVIVSQIVDLESTCEWLNKDSQDNGDPYYDLGTVLQYCSKALSSLTVYASEYAADAKKELSNSSEVVTDKAKGE